MATILLVFIYIFYIGLGVPDSLLGAAWPAIYSELSVPVSYASFISSSFPVERFSQACSVRESSQSLVLHA